MLPHEELAQIFEFFAVWHTIQATPFRPQVYELAMESMLAYGPEVKTIWKTRGTKGLKEIPGVGEAIAAKIDEFFRTRHVKEYEQFRKHLPIDVHGLMKIEGLGPKHIWQLWKALNVKDVSSLEKALKQKKVETLPGFGAKSEERLLKAVELMKIASERKPLDEVLPVADSIIKRLLKIPGVKHCVYAGSLRRKKSTIGDIDLIATTSTPKRVMEAFIHLPEVTAIHDFGPTRSSVRLSIGIDADLRVVPDKVFGATLQYFTGDRRHNIILREYAIRQGYKLNEYGLFKGKKLIACKTEEEIYKKLGFETPLLENRLGGDEFIPLEKKGRTQKSEAASPVDRPKKAASLRSRSSRKSPGRKA